MEEVIIPDSIVTNEEEIQAQIDDIVKTIEVANTDKRNKMNKAFEWFVNDMNTQADKWLNINGYMMVLDCQKAVGFELDRQEINNIMQSMNTLCWKYAYGWETVDDALKHYSDFLDNEYIADITKETMNKREYVYQYIVMQFIAGIAKHFNAMEEFKAQADSAIKESETKLEELKEQLSKLKSEE